MASKDVKLSKPQNMSMVFSCVFRVENASFILPRIIYDHQHIINIYVCIYIYMYMCTNSAEVFRFYGWERVTLGGTDCAR